MVEGVEVGGAIEAAQCVEKGLILAKCGVTWARNYCGEQPRGYEGYTIEEISFISSYSSESTFIYIIPSTTLPKLYQIYTPKHGNSILQVLDLFIDYL